MKAFLVIGHILLWIALGALLHGLYHELACIPGFGLDPKGMGNLPPPMTDTPPAEKIKVSAAYLYAVPPPRWPDPMPLYEEVSAKEACIAWCKGAAVCLITFGGGVGSAALLIALLPGWLAFLLSVFVAPCVTILLADFTTKRFGVLS